MSILKRCLPVLVLAGLAVSVGLPRPRAAQARAKGRLLYLTLSAGFKHDTVAPSRGIVTEIGKASGAFDVTVADDVSPFTDANLKNYDAVMFYTTGELPMSAPQKEALLDFVRSGHGFVGVHSATDTFYMWPEYLEMIGGYFNDHPWHQNVTVDVVDPGNPIVSALAPSFQINDEIYQMSDFQYRDSHVLLRLDPNSVDLNKAGVHRRFYGWPLAWTRNYGEGRVFYTALGHELAVWKDPRYQQMLLNGIKWAMGR
ncbi:MAG TPA: ThuA domain-containing protein [Terriglobia bacterium]|nr:ThuA domain-containing protein [Terriglobia bacterium]